MDHFFSGIGIALVLVISVLFKGVREFYLSLFSKVKLFHWTKSHQEQSLKVEIHSIDSQENNSIKSIKQSTKNPEHFEKEEHNPKEIAINENSLLFPVRLFLEAFKKEKKEEQISEVFRLVSEWREKKTHSEEDIEENKYFVLKALGYDKLEDELIELENREQDWYFPSDQLVRIFLSVDAFDNAKMHLERAKARAQSEMDKSKVILLESEIYEKKQSVDDAINFLKDCITRCSVDKVGQIRILEEIANLYDKNSDIKKKCFTLEKAVDLDPTNKDLRFKLAYAYSEQEDSQLLSYYHYEKLLMLDPDNYTSMNNLSITCKKLSLEKRQDDLLNFSANYEGYSLGNLIINYVEAGLFHLADSQIKKIPVKLKNTERVIQAVEYFYQQVEENNALEKARMADAEKYKKFIANTIDRDFIIPKDVIGHWNYDNFEIELRFDFSANKVQGELRKSQFGSMFNRVEYFDIDGAINGSILSLIVTRNNIKSPPQGLLGTLMESMMRFKLFMSNKEKLIGIKSENNFVSIKEVEFIKNSS